MVLYYFIAIFPIFLSILLYNKKYKKIYISICFLILLFFSAFRGYYVGGDLINYLPLFDDISKHSIMNVLFPYDKYGWLFKLFFYICSLISNHPSFFLFCESAFILYLVCYFISKTSKIYSLSILIFITFGFYTNTFNSIRSSFALYVAAIGIINLLQNKRWRAFVFFLLAFEIHKTILPIFILLFFKKYKLSFVAITLLISSSFLLSSVIGISGLAPIILLYSDSYLNTVDFGGGGYTLLLMDIIITYGSYFLSRNSNDRTIQLMLFLIVIATCLQTIAPIFSIATRVSYFFLFYIVILIPNIIYIKFKGINYKFVYTAVTIISLMYFKITIMTPSPSTHTNTQATIPYYFFWERKQTL